MRECMAHSWRPNTEPEERRHASSRYTATIFWRNPVTALVMVIAALGSGLVAGVFFAFSTFVMPALARIPAANGIVAMQSINVAAINRWLMGLLLGTAVACLWLGVTALVRWNEPGARYRLAASAIYLVGAIGVTRGFNVPRNDALAVLDPGTASAAAFWQRYLVEWCVWNHVRGGAAFVAAALLTVALVKPFVTTH
jgi:uncharacterized membrane protein